MDTGVLKTSSVWSHTSSWSLRWTDSCWSGSHFFSSDVQPEVGMVMEAVLVLVVEQLLWQEMVPVCMLLQLVVRDDYCIHITII